MALATTEPETFPGPEGAAEEERKARDDTAAMARGGLLNLVGAAGTGLLTFALVTVLTRGLGAASYGAFVSAMGLFTILSNTAELGADTGPRPVDLTAPGPRPRPRHPQDRLHRAPPAAGGVHAVRVGAVDVGPPAGRNLREGRRPRADRRLRPVDGAAAARRRPHPGDPVRHPGLRHHDAERGGRQARPPLPPGGGGAGAPRGRRERAGQPRPHRPVVGPALRPRSRGRACGGCGGSLLKAERRDRRANGRRRSRSTPVLADEVLALHRSPGPGRGLPDRRAVAQHPAGRAARLDPVGRNLQRRHPLGHGRPDGRCGRSAGGRAEALGADGPAQLGPGPGRLPDDDVLAHGRHLADVPDLRLLLAHAAAALRQRLRRRRRRPHGARVHHAGRHGGRAPSTSSS